MKEIYIQNLWIFKLGSQESMNDPLWMNVVFQQRDRQDSQSVNIDTFKRLSVISAQCIIGTENYLDAAILINFDDFSLRFGQFEEVFRALTKDDILQPYISDHDFRIHMGYT